MCYAAGSKTTTAKQMDKLASWVSSIGGMLGAALCSMGFMRYGYPVFFIGAIAGVYVVRRNTPMALQFAFFTVANAIGIYNFTL